MNEKFTPEFKKSLLTPLSDEMKAWMDKNMSPKGGICASGPVRRFTRENWAADPNDPIPPRKDK
jgi:hypothetical protein